MIVWPKKKNFEKQLLSGIYTKEYYCTFVAYKLYAICGVSIKFIINLQAFNI